jgi:hypothetical protein
MQNNDLSNPRDLVLYQEFSSLQFGKFQIVGGGVVESFREFVLECLVPPLELRKMRFDRHVANLLACVITPKYACAAMLHPYDELKRYPFG